MRAASSFAVNRCTSSAAASRSASACGAYHTIQHVRRRQPGDHDVRHPLVDRVGAPGHPETRATRVGRGPARLPRADQPHPTSARVPAAPVDAGPQELDRLGVAVLVPVRRAVPLGDRVVVASEISGGHVPLTGGPRRRAAPRRGASADPHRWPAAPSSRPSSTASLADAGADPAGSFRSVAIASAGSRSSRRRDDVADHRRLVRVFHMPLDRLSVVTGRVDRLVAVGQRRGQLPLPGPGLAVAADPLGCLRATR